jgi:hypothetical protein
MIEIITYPSALRRAIVSLQIYRVILSEAKDPLIQEILRRLRGSG